LIECNVLTTEVALCGETARRSFAHQELVVSDNWASFLVAKLARDKMDMQT